MHPILLKLGPITIYTYGVMVALGIFFGSLVLIRLAEREGIKREDIVDTAFWSVVAGLVGARVFFFLYNPELAKPLYRILFIWEGGLVWYGGVVFGALTTLYFVKKRKIPLWRFADVVSIALSVGLGFGRIGCTMAGCCYGKTCHSPIAIVFKDPHSAAPLGIPLCPTQPLSALANFLIAALLYLFYRSSRRKPGQVFGLYLVLYGLFRFFIEFLRATPKEFWGLSNNQLISVAMVAAGVLIFLKRGKEASSPNQFS